MSRSFQAALSRSFQAAADRAARAFLRDAERRLASRNALRDFLAADPKLGGVDVQALANRLHARGLRAPKGK